MTFALSIILAAVSGWLVYAFPQFILFTTTAAAWCESLFLRCLEYLIIFKIFWLGFVIIGGLFLYALIKAIFLLIKTSRQIKRLPLAHASVLSNTQIKDRGFIVIQDEGLKTAFTHGLLHPKIYISAGLIATLDDSEFEAVYLHELCHKQNKDPLRFLLLSMVRDMFLYLPIAKFMQGLIHKYVEKTADNAVVRKMNEPLSLAGAIVKIAEFHKENMMLQPVSINGYGSPEARIRRLVEGKDEAVQLPGRKTIAASIVMAGFLAASLAMPLFASFPDAKQCDTSHCDMHKDKLGKDCQKHCKNMKQHEHSAHTTF